jgi:hypothetical protein
MSKSGDVVCRCQPPIADMNGVLPLATCRSSVIRRRWRLHEQDDNVELSWADELLDPLHRGTSRSHDLRPG